MLPAVALGVTLRLVPETPRAPGRRPDLAGAALMFGTLGAASVALIVGAGTSTAGVPLVASAAAVLGGVALVYAERRAADPMLPARLLRRREFLGGNLVWLLAAMTSWGAVFFLAVMLQTTLGLRPLVAGLTLTPIYLVMMVGSPLAGWVADHAGPRWPILGGLAAYAVGLFLLGRLGAHSSVVPDVLFAVLVMAVGMAAFSAPLASVTMGTLDRADQGAASGVNNAAGQLAGLLAIVVLPAVAGLAGVGFGSDEFADGCARALRVAAMIAAVCIPLAAWLVTPRRSTPPVAAAVTGRSARVAQAARPYPVSDTRMRIGAGVRIECRAGRQRRHA